MIRFTLNGLIRQLEGGTNDDILNSAFDETVFASGSDIFGGRSLSGDFFVAETTHFAPDSESADEEEPFLALFDGFYDDDEFVPGRRNETESESSAASS